ncbi:MAG: Txe/YoeB family addiction module toxin [Runella slithyformis]|nr:MAG: Txe/YoeB family addiction module toxin [Runella slithyformis]TAG23747.1 MAG: Txe/YoeB family addiction module toxin [Cytophagales bacterium]TAG43046.1 MAG: Txe/YoeB family addiction module toxin [Cytophagia bacterium]TAF45283.1 MAG: Txe/YoeB family addiction module toxin [Runella slithyformis]TAG76491.1 MAG: Txe/YoeB family addiction module toxin [Cytophagales bacterium]
MRNISIRPEAWEELKFWIEEKPKVALRIHRILNECCRTPFEGIGKPEPLKGNFKNKWSRRIDDEHRLVYEVTDTEITVFSLRGHYE